MPHRGSGLSFSLNENSNTCPEETSRKVPDYPDIRENQTARTYRERRSSLRVFVSTLVSLRPAVKVLVDSP